MGKIYIIRNSSFKPGIVKIGYTARDSETRSQEISASTGVPEKFEVLYEEDVVNCKKAEKIIHNELKKYRVSANKEFFSLPLKLAVKAVFSICSQINDEQLKKIIIVVNSGQLSPRDLSKIKKILEGNPGEVELEMNLVFQHKGELSLSFAGNFKVKFSEKLITNLSAVDCVEEVICN